MVTLGASFSHPTAGEVHLLIPLVVMEQKLADQMRAGRELANMYESLVADPSQTSNPTAAQCFDAHRQRQAAAMAAFATCMAPAVDPTLLIACLVACALAAAIIPPAGWVFLGICTAACLTASALLLAIQFAICTNDMKAAMNASFAALCQCLSNASASLGVTCSQPLFQCSCAGEPGFGQGCLDCLEVDEMLNDLDLPCPIATYGCP